MWELATNLSEVGGGLLLVAWGITGYRAGRLAKRPTQTKLRRGVRSLLALLGLDLLVLLVQVVMVALTWAHGWVFAENRVALALPPILAAAAAVVAWSLPRLRRLARAAPADPRAPAQASDRSRASDPWLVVPVKAAAVGALLDFWVVFVARPAPPYLLDAVIAWAVLISAVALLWWRQRGRHRLPL
jgi:hypothetical protein